MTAKNEWKASLHSFFDQRGGELLSHPTLQELCYVSGRDPRLWSDPVMYGDLIRSIVDSLSVSKSASILEVGCAAGFIANGVAPLVKNYIGIDLARNALVAAGRLGLPNAVFKHSDGSSVPLQSSSVDAAFCYDVVTNFPSFDDVEPLIAEMLRVVRPGGKVMIGSVPDAACRDEYEQRIQEVAKELDAKFGPSVPQVNGVKTNSLLKGVIRHLFRRPSAPPPAIFCYYFSRADFRAVAQRFGVRLVFGEIHEMNPYRGHRFNAIFQRVGS